MSGAQTTLAARAPWPFPKFRTEAEQAAEKTVQAAAATTAPDPDEWHKGPPPHVGWWSASRYGNTFNAWRWWDGQRWSEVVYSNQSAIASGYGAQIPADECMQAQIKWRWYWPQGARVARINPLTGEVTGKGPQP